MKTYTTTPNAGYVATVVSVPCTVSAVLDNDQTVDLVVAQEAGQYTFCAPTDEVSVNTDDVVISHTSTAVTFTQGETSLTEADYINTGNETQTCSTTPGSGYIVTVVTAPCMVSAILENNATSTLILTDQPGQYGFMAPSDQIVIDRNDAILSKADQSVAMIGADHEEYILPAATTTTLGGIAVGEGLSVSETGLLSANLPDTLAKTDVSNTFSKDQIFRTIIKTHNIWSINGTRNLLQTQGNVGSILKLGEASAFNLLFACYNARPTVTIGSTNKGAVVTEDENNTFTGVNNFTMPLGVGNATTPEHALTLGQADNTTTGYAKLNRANKFTGEQLFNGVIRMSTTTVLGTGENVNIVDANARPLLRVDSNNISLGTTSKKRTIQLNGVVSSIDENETLSTVATESRNNTFTGRNNFTQSVGVADGVLPGDAVNFGQLDKKRGFFNNLTNEYTSYGGMDAYQADQEYPNYISAELYGFSFPAWGEQTVSWKMIIERSTSQPLAYINSPGDASGGPHWAMDSNLIGKTLEADKTYIVEFTCIVYANASAPTRGFASLIFEGTSQTN